MPSNEFQPIDFDTLAASPDEWEVQARRKSTWREKLKAEYPDADTYGGSPDSRIDYRLALEQSPDGSLYWNVWYRSNPWKGYGDRTTLRVWDGDGVEQDRPFWLDEVVAKYGVKKHPVHNPLRLSSNEKKYVAIIRPTGNYALTYGYGTIIVGSRKDAERWGDVLALYTFDGVEVPKPKPTPREQALEWLAANTDSAQVPTNPKRFFHRFISVYNYGSWDQDMSLPEAEARAVSRESWEESSRVNFILDLYKFRVYRPTIQVQIKRDLEVGPVS
jgi:hypothetical protein